MAYRIAVASTDGEHIDTHFGHADHFLIYEVYEEGDEGHAPGDVEELEDRPARPACGSDIHCGGIENSEERESVPASSDPMDAAARNLADIDYVLAAMAGPHAVKTLEKYDVTVFSVVLPIPDAIQKISIYRKRSGRTRRAAD